MKKIMSSNKKILLLIALALIIVIIIALATFAASRKTSFEIPDVLQKTVGTVSMTSVTTGITNAEGYQAVMIRTFNDTTDVDYAALMEHYTSASTGTGENNSLLFDWGWLIVTTVDHSITFTAYFK